MDYQRTVTFNAGAPTQTQSWAGALGRWLLIVIGIGGCAAVWCASAWFNARFVAGFFAEWYTKALWGCVAVGMDVVKSAMPIVMGAARERDEIATRQTAIMLLIITLMLSAISGTIYIFGRIPNFSPPVYAGQGVLENAIAGKFFILARLAAALLLTVAIEAVTTFGFATVLVGARALRESYDETPPAAEAPAMLEPALGSFERGFSAWAAECIGQDVSGRLASPQAYRHYSDWARFNGPYEIPKPESFGKALRAHCEALGASSTRSGGRTAYAGVTITKRLQPLQLPAAAQ